MISVAINCYGLLNKSKYLWQIQGYEVKICKIISKKSNYVFDLDPESLFWTKDKINFALIQTFCGKNILLYNEQPFILQTLYDEKVINDEQAKALGPFWPFVEY